MKLLGGFFNYPELELKKQELEIQVQDPNIWNNQEVANKATKELSQIKDKLQSLDSLRLEISDSIDLLELFDLDDELSIEINKSITQITKRVELLEFERMFSSNDDNCNAYISIQSGSGGTEAQDWASMLMRMYLRYFEKKDFKAEIQDVASGDVAGIKGCTIHIEGPYAYGWLKTELGVHRLVRKSPFDSSNKRHTSFASVFVSPEIDDNIEIEINPADLRIDTFRASGAGGQHVNKTDSAIRITHLPTGEVVQCQSDRSQHKNRANAFKQLKSKLYELEQQKLLADKQAIEDNKQDIGWGSQIRSYVLDQSRIKDLRTNVENKNPQQILDGDLDKFIIPCLKAKTV